MSDFNREDRYIVIKRKDLNVVPFAALQSFLEHLGALASFLPQREFVVVESDWPECEQVWRMIEARVTGQLSDLERLEAEAQALREEVLRERQDKEQALYALGQSEDANAALRARVVVPDGYVLVPVEPTRDMFISVNKEDDKAYAGGCDHGAQFDWLWDAALEAAPRLNGKAVSEGLLREIVRVIDDATWTIQAKPSCQSGVVERCKCRLCTGTRLVMARNDLSELLGEGKES